MIRPRIDMKSGHIGSGHAVRAIAARVFQTELVGAMLRIVAVRRIRAKHD
jgi:hypothetical protein